MISGTAVEQVNVLIVSAGLSGFGAAQHPRRAAPGVSHAIVVQTTSGCFGRYRRRGNRLTPKNRTARHDNQH